MSDRDKHIIQLRTSLEEVRHEMTSMPEYNLEYSEILTSGEPSQIRLDSLIDMLKSVCTGFGGHYSSVAQIKDQICDSLDELQAMVGMHESLVYPFLKYADKLDHSLFDGSIYTIIQVLKDSADKVRAALTMKPWEVDESLDETYQLFADTLSLFTDKIIRYIDVHDRFVYPVAIDREETFDL